MSMIKITINNKEYQVNTNISILQACEQVGIELPRFCYHEKLSVAGNCRMCLVEVQKSPKPVVSCAMPVSKDMVVYTETPLVKKAREAVVEFLLVNHPLDCPICDQGGECDLQDETLAYGSDRGRFFEYKRSVEDKECGPIVKTIMTRCIHCTRCIRFSAEVAGNEVLGAFGRGSETEIGTYLQSFIKTELSGNLVDLCPVGALTSKPYAYIARSWEVQKTDSVDFFDGVCSDTVIHTKNFGSTQTKNSSVVYKEEIVRILPRLNGLYTDNWISDRARYAFDGLKKQRIEYPMLLDENNQYVEISWELAGSVIADNMVQNMQSLAFKTVDVSVMTKHGGLLLGNITDLEGVYAISQFLKLYGNSNIQYGNYLLYSNIDAPFFYSLNRTLSSFNDLGTLLLIGTNTRIEASMVNTILRRVQNKNALTYYSLGNFSVLKLKHGHLGINLRSLIAMLHNRTEATSTMFKSKNSSIIVGFENFKAKGSMYLQLIVRKISKKICSKNKSGDRFGVLHSNTTTLGLSNLGVQAGVRSVLHLTGIDKKFDYLLTWNMSDIDSSKWMSSVKYTNVYSFGTHKLNNVNVDMYLPTKSFYEKDSFLINVEGRVRKANKAVTSLNKIQSLEVILMSIWAVHLEKESFLETIWTLSDEVKMNEDFDFVNKSFNFNFFAFNENKKTAPLFIFKPTLTGFYMVDPISKASSIMAECSLFLEKENNFNI